MPYGMSVLFAYLKDKGFKVSQQDFLMDYLYRSADDIDYHSPNRSFTKEDFAAQLKGTGNHAGLSKFVDKYTVTLPRSADIYAFSIVAYHQFWAALILARRIREMNPWAVIVFGGPFITVRPARTFVPHGQADYWVKGSGEAPLAMLSYHLHSRESVPVSSIPGLVYVRNGRIIENPQSRLPAEDEFAPDFEGLNLDQYRYDHPMAGASNLFLPYRVSKGCPSRCSFCTGRLVDRHSIKSPDKISSEMQALAATYASNSFQFADASINGLPDHFGQVCDRLISDLPGIRWYSYARISGATPALVEKAAKSGCFALFWGVEAARQETINFLGKRFSTDQLFTAINAARRCGIKSYVHIMYNTPHETAEDIDALKALIDRYIGFEDVVFMPMRFLLEPESLIYRRSADYGITNISRVDRSMFDREEYRFDEVNGPTHDQIVRRNRRHRDILSDHLSVITAKAHQGVREML